MDYFSATFAISLLQIIWIDILLSGDNAVVIALACRSLPPDKQKLGIRLGAATAVVLRIIFAIIITYLLAIPYLRIVGGLMLLWIAINLVKAEEEEENDIKAHDSLFAAVRTIAIADVVMSLDNVVAISAASKGHIPLFVIGLLISIPLRRHRRLAHHQVHSPVPDPHLVRRRAARLDRRRNDRHRPLRRRPRPHVQRGSQLW